jgi:carbonic anhydrase
VLGHTKCGAVKGACDGVEMGNLTALLSKIQPAVDDEKTETENRSSANSGFVEKVSKLNVKRTVQDIMQRSPILKEMIDAGSLGIVGGIHDITAGEVLFYPETLVLNSKWASE